MERKNVAGKTGANQKMRYLFPLSPYNQQRQFEKPVWVYPAHLAMYATYLRNQGHEVYNPASANLEGMPLKKILAHVLWWLCHEAEAIAFLPGWRRSGGARIEFLIAKYLGYTIIKL